MESKTVWAIYNDPLVLLNIKKPKIIEEINAYLPYSCGMEIECMHSPHFRNTFSNIPDIMDVDNSSPDYEQRYRIPSGLKGMVCLFRVCEELIKQCVYHPRSGHHYHCDCTDIVIKGEYGWKMPHTEVLERNKDWILEELDKWEYKGDYNSRRVNGGWIRWNSGHGTLEFRIGEMTFDYSVIIKRLIHACEITKKIKAQLFLTPEEQELISLRQKIIDEEKKLDKPIITDIPTANQLIKKRVIKL
jgi:hypothetical protein